MFLLRDELNFVNGRILYVEELSCVVCDSMELIEDINQDIWENKEYKKQIILSAEGVAVMAEFLAGYKGYKFEKKRRSEMD